MKLSKRLEAIIEVITPTQSCADIGSDHGLLMIELINRGIIQEGVAIDNKKGPLAILKQNINQAGLQEKISVILSDGAKNLQSNVDCWVIAGIGGENSCQIVIDSLDKAISLKQLIISPHSKHEVVRETMANYGFKLIEESLVFDDKYYVIMKYVYDQPHQLTIREKYLGKLSTSSHYKDYLKELYKYYKNIIKLQPVQDDELVTLISLINQELRPN